MQVEVHVKCMETNFGGHGLSGFEDFAPFCLPSEVDYSPWSKREIKLILSLKL